jgi:hypothetical protein
VLFFWFAEIPPGKCRTSLDCGAFGAECSFAGSRATRQCTCTDGLADTCMDLGTCIETPCSKCRSCISRVTPFTYGSLTDSNDTVLAKWLPFCSSQMGQDGLLCNSTHSLIAQSARGYLGRRAGALCALLQQCPPPEMLPNCTLSHNVTATEVITGNLSLCTIQGISGNGTMLPDTVLIPPPMSNTSCKITADCRDPNLVCMVPAATNETCVCVAGKDDCFKLGTCTRTPAKVCTDCLTEWAAFGNATLNQTDAVSLSQAFLSNCNSTRSMSVCDPVAQIIASSANFGKRSTGICTMLPDCSPGALPNTTSLRIPGLIPGTVLEGSSLMFDYCTVEGFPGGKLLPDFYPVNRWPLGACSDDANCTGIGAGLFCNKTISKAYCTCSNGTNTCLDIGVCQPTPCTRCQRCLQTFTSQFVAANLFQPKDTVVANFNASCTALQEDKNDAICQVVTSSINGSTPNGVLGRRAGGICRALGACDLEALANCTMTVTSPDQRNATGALSLCRVQGVSGGTLPYGISNSSGE